VEPFSFVRNALGLSSLYDLSFYAKTQVQGVKCNSTVVRDDWAHWNVISKQGYVQPGMYIISYLANITACFCWVLLQRWSSGEHVPFLHLEASHPLPLLSDWYSFCFKFKLALWVTRGCAWIHVGRSVWKLAGLKAHSDHQNPKKVALQGKTAYVGLHPHLVDRFTPFLLQWCCLL
jgi:hypothetical protein